MTMKPNDYTDLMYRESGKVAHYVPFGDGRALCGMRPGKDGLGNRDEWYGTGTFDEYETAAAMSLCVLCEEKVS